MHKCLEEIYMDKNAKSARTQVEFPRKGALSNYIFPSSVLQRLGSHFSSTVKWLFLIATLLPSISMQVTVYQIITKLSLVDTMLAPIVLYVGTDIISIYIFMQFLNNISISLDESAIMDGASYIRI